MSSLSKFTINLRSINQKQANWSVGMTSNLIAGFFGKNQYATKPERRLEIKFPKARFIRLFLHTLIGIESIKDIPVELPKQQVFKKIVNGNDADCISSVNLL